jgi:hypothetical protein
MSDEKKKYTCREKGCKGRVGFDDISLWRTHMLIAHDFNFRKYADYKQK